MKKGQLPLEQLALFKFTDGLDLYLITQKTMTHQKPACIEHQGLTKIPERVTSLRSLRKPRRARFIAKT